MKMEVITSNRKPTFNDAEAGMRLEELYYEAQNGMRKIIALGLFCFEVKANIKHGEFEPWLNDNCPGLSIRSLQNYMKLTVGVLERCGFQLGGALPICQGGEILLLDEADVPAAGQALRGKIFDIIDGKSAHQLMLEFKADKAATAPKAQPRKLSPAQAEEEARLNAEEWAKGLIGANRMASSELGLRNFSLLPHWLKDQVVDSGLDMTKAFTPMLRKTK